MHRSLQLCLVILPVLLFPMAHADEAAEREAIRVEIEQLRYTGHLSVGDVDVASGELLAEVYERRAFEPAWKGIERLVSLIEFARATEAPTIWSRNSSRRRSIILVKITRGAI